MDTSVTPFLVVSHGARAVEFYIHAFCAKELVRYEMPGGKLMAKIGIGNSEWWVGDEEPEFDNLSPATIGGTSFRMIFTVDDPEAIFSKALEAGATSICPVRTEEFWKIGKLKDPFGHVWEIGHPLVPEPK